MRLQSRGGSPILVGAVTCLITVIAVFLSYNANQGLPFVPTYDVTVQVPDAAGLVAGNDVRVGGKRVGTIAKISARKTAAGRTLAQLDLKLDQTEGPLYTGAQVTVRPRSPLGLKYLDLVPRKIGRKLADREPLPLRQARTVVDLDEVFNAFDQGTRRNLQLTLVGLGDGLAGRGADFNAVLAAAPPLARDVRNVSANLADPHTNLSGAVNGVASTVEELAPVASQLGGLVDASDTTAGALASVTPELQDTIAGLPPTEAVGTHALAVARPVLADARALVHDIRPGTRVLASAATDLHGAIRVGIPVVRRALGLSERLRTTLQAVDTLASDPRTSGTLDRLQLTLESALPTLRFISPAQTICNYFGLWTRNVPSTISEGDDSGTWFRTLVVANTDEARANAAPSPNLHVNQYGNTAAPGQVHECEAGNEPYLPGQRIGHVPGNQGTRTQRTP
ncbi:MAG: phospholipid/cholesterol/gamma-HCH transport system substrate-binding protein [Thermoleophilaceae bacterium]|jgi:virulence factor Mce-like protein|nr:phospholipid/cholesterol/gamma-HCH transport system substrate-binding protein [Thermoleophilaceae bacterium]